MTTFSAETYQNEFLPAGGTRVDAIVTVTSSGGATAAPSAQARAEVIIIDVSGSMKAPRQKLKAAIAATTAAIDCLPDGTLFGIIAGNSDARRVYPTGGELATASAATRNDAKQEVSQLRADRGDGDRPLADGGLQLVRRLPRGHPPRHPAHRRDERVRRPSTSRPRSSPARARSSATAEASAPTGTSTSCGRSRTHCSARSTSWPHRRA